MHLVDSRPAVDTQRPHDAVPTGRFDPMLSLAAMTVATVVCAAASAAYEIAALVEAADEMVETRAAFVASHAPSHGSIVSWAVIAQRTSDGWPADGSASGE